MIEELKVYRQETDTDSRPRIGDLVYGLYQTDDLWYRCLVTNCDETGTNYELFYIDFGNTEVASIDGILAPWTSAQARVMLNNEPQAYKCNLYGISSKSSRPSDSAKNSTRFVSSFDDEQNERFKNFSSNKLYSVRFLDQIGAAGDDSFFGVCLDEVVGNNKIVFASVHKYLFIEKFINFWTIDEVIHKNCTQQQKDFFTELINTFTC